VKPKDIASLSLTVLAAIATVIVVAFANQQSSAVRTAWLHIFSATQLCVGFIGYVWLGGKKAKCDLWIEFDAQRIRRLFILMVTWALALTVVFTLTRRSDEFSARSAAFNAWQLVYFLGLIALPEEIFFRGFPFLALGRYSARAVFVSAGLFSLIHINIGPHTLPYYFALGLLLGVLRRFGTTLAELTIWHGLFNFVVIVWPDAGFRFSETGYFVVAPLAFLSITALAGWALSAEWNLKSADQ